MKLSRTQKDTIKYFKKREGLFDNIPLTDFMVREVAAAWGKMAIKLNFDASRPPADPVEKWAWLWSNCTFDAVELSYLTGLREQVLFALAKAKGHRLIYPDGSISRLAEISILLPFMGEDDKIKYGLTKKKSKQKV